MPEDKTLNGGNIGIVTKYVSIAVGAVLGLSSFYFLAEMGQNAAMREQGKELVAASTSLSTHLAASLEESRKMRETLREQRAHNVKTSNTLTEVCLIQKTLQDTDARICNELEELKKKVAE